jgi:MFS family permease
MPIGAYFAGRRTSVTGRYKPMILTGAVLMPISILGMAFSPPQAIVLSSLFMLLSGIAGACSSRRHWWAHRTQWNNAT